MSSHSFAAFARHGVHLPFSGVMSTLGLLGMLASPVAGGTPPASAGALFPVAIEVEHRVAEVGPDGVGFLGDPVVDRWVDHRFVSTRSDGSRFVVDFAKKEVLDIDARRGTVSVLSWERFAELRRRLAAAERSPAPPPPAAVARLAVAELPANGADVAAPPKLAGSERPLTGTRRFRASLSAGGPALVEAWVDPTIRFSPEARRALATFEIEVLGDGGAGGAALAEIREKGEGALIVRTRRSRSAELADAFTEDVVTRTVMPATLPAGLFEIPDGYRRVPHPLEALVAAMEEEAAVSEMARGAAR